METPETDVTVTMRPVWNAGRNVGAKRALKPKQIWEIRFYLNECRRLRDLPARGPTCSGCVTG